MLSITVELGIGGRASRIGRMTISNDGTGTALVGNYDVVWTSGEVTLRCRVEAWPRAERSGMLLIAEAMRTMDAKWSETYG